MCEHDSSIVGNDAIDVLEKSFPFKDLLDVEYFKKYRADYYDMHAEGWQVPTRNYYNLLAHLREIHEFRQDDAKAFAKNFRTSSGDWNNGEATFAEIIVYRYYVPLVREGIVKDVRRGGQECDILVERVNGTTAYLEVFSVRPDSKLSEPPNFVVNDRKAHTQDAKGSIRQKLLRKLNEQHQMTKPRENYAVIELNDVSIAGNFAVLSSLSGGYQVHIDLESNQVVGRGFDWTKSIFHDETTRHLKGVIFFDVGDYETRRILLNPFFSLA